MWKQRWRIVVLLFFSFVGLSAFGEGGLLKLTSISPDDPTRSWPEDLINVGTDPSQSVEIRLEDGTRVEGTIVDFFQEEKAILSNENPPRMILDANQDKTYQANEITIGEPLEKTTPSQDAFSFRNIRMPIELDTSAPRQRYILSFDVIVTRYQSDYTECTVIRACDCFEGTITAGGTNYAARLIVRTFTSSNNFPKTLLFLDTNRDGRYIPVDDEWFSTHGIASIENRLWTVSTHFREAEAEVSLTPYEGSVGILQLEGDGLEQIGLRLSDQSMRAGSFNSVFEFSLPRRAGLTYTLPSESYEITKIWLSPTNDPDQLYQFPALSGHVSPPIIIRENETTTQNVGGPLNLSIRAQANWLLGEITLKHEGCKNEGGLSFAGLTKSELVSGTELPPPSWEIRDQRGTIICSGRFAYG